MIVLLELLGLWVLAGVLVVIAWNAAKKVVPCRNR